eukprot:scaffold1505_cov256-Pinguiococcus_pyrenoidosus.AAC.20
MEGVEKSERKAAAESSQKFVWCRRARCGWCPRLTPRQATADAEGRDVPGGVRRGQDHHPAGRPGRQLLHPGRGKRRLLRQRGRSRQEGGSVPALSRGVSLAEHLTPCLGAGVLDGGFFW